MTRIGVTIRMNASTNSITGPGFDIDRTALTPSERGIVRRGVVHAWTMTNWRSKAASTVTK